MNFLDEETKLFLLKVLKESGGANQKKPVGPTWNPTGTGGSTLLTPEEAKSAAGSTAAAMSQDKYYKDALKMGLSSSTGMDEKMLDKEGQAGPSLELLGALGTLKRTMGYKTGADSTSDMLGVPFVTPSGINYGKLFNYAASRAAKAGLGAAALSYGMGPLGQNLAGKLPRLALLGVDPFDYATKIMGVDYASDQLSKLAANQKKQIVSGAGYIKL